MADPGAEIRDRHGFLIERPLLYPQSGESRASRVVSTAMNEMADNSCREDDLQPSAASYMGKKLAAGPDAFGVQFALAQAYGSLVKKYLERGTDTANGGVREGSWIEAL